MPRTSISSLRRSVPNTASFRHVSSPESEVKLNSNTAKFYQSILDERKSWKSTRTGEHIWTPRLEKALIAALEEYEPTNSMAARRLGRFPKRNKFISRYMYRVTGAYRTPKQVGSRIQQLKETTGEAAAYIHRLLQHSRPSSGSSSEDESDSKSDGKRPNSPSSATSPDWSDAVGPIPSPSSPTYSPARSPTSSPLPPQQNEIISLLRDDEWSAVDDGLQPIPRQIRSIDPSVAVTSASPLALGEHYAAFYVYCGGVLAHTERVHLREAVGAPGAGNLCVYTTNMVPSYWETICASDDPTQYRIHMDIMSTSNADKEAVVLTIVYHFDWAYSQSEPFVDGVFTPQGLYAMPLSSPAHFEALNNVKFEDYSPSHQVDNFLTAPLSFYVDEGYQSFGLTQTRDATRAAGEVYQYQYDARLGPSPVILTNAGGGGGAGFLPFGLEYYNSS